MFNQLYYNKFTKVQASQIALTNNHLDGIKYIYSDQKSYLSFYDQYNDIQALKVAEQLKDVNGIRYIYKKTKRDYLKYLYNGTPQRNINKAQDLNDLKGFKYICKAINMSYFDLLYKINANSIDIESDIANKLYYAAVTLEDHAGVNYILTNAQALHSTQLTSILKNQTHIIRDAYYKNNLATAYELVEAGAKFEKMYITKPVHNPKLNRAMYTNHLNDLQKNGYIEDKEYQQTIALLDVLFADPLKKLDNHDLGYSLYEMLASTTYTGGASLPKIQTIFDQYIAAQYQPVQDIIKFTALTNLDKKPVDILLPDNGHNTDPHYSGNIILNPHKDYYIYTPLNINETQSALLHEMGHFLFDAMFNNSAKVYTDFDYKNHTMQYTEFRIAAKSTLVNILRLLQNQDKTIANKDFIEIAKYLKTSGELLLNHYIYDIRQGVTNVALETSLLTAYGSADKVALQKLLHSSQDKRIKVLTEIYTRYHWSQDESYLLERITDYVGRDEKQYDIELVNRLPELQIKGLNQKALHQLDPLANWWQNFITPVVGKLVNAHIDQCKAWIKAESIKNNSNEYCILDLYNKNDSKNLLLSLDTRCELIEAAINSFSYVEGKKSDTLVRSKAEKELLYSVNHDGQAQCVEKIISKFETSEIIKHQAFQEAVENVYVEYVDIFLKYTNIDHNIQTEALRLSITKMANCIPAVHFDDFCSKLSLFIKDSNKAMGSFEDISCAVYNHISQFYEYNDLENLIGRLNEEKI